MRILLIFCSIIFACNSKHVEPTVITGDLYFGVFLIGNYYNQPDSLIEFYENYFDTTNFDNSVATEKKLFAMYNNLKDRDLLYKPFVLLHVNQDSVIRLYLEPEQYNSIKIYKRQDLQQANQKLQIKSTVDRLDSGLYFCKELLDVKLVEGQTLQRQKKFKLQDYD